MQVNVTISVFPKTVTYKAEDVETQLAQPQYT